MSLVDTLREESKPGIWSLGVKLARSGAVTLESRTAEEVSLRVRAAGRPVAPSVTLYPDDEAWDCDCGGPADPCEHVVAGAIALTQAEASGEGLASSQAKWTRVVYELSRAGHGLALGRSLAHADGSRTPLAGSLVDWMKDPARAAALQLDPCDLLADRLLERPTRGPLPPDRLANVLKVLEPARNVQLDGRPVAISTEAMGPVVRVEDRGAETALVITRDPRVSEVLSAGIARADDVLCYLAETELTGTWLEKLPITRLFGAAELGELSARVLPELARRLPVKVASRRLPPIDRDLKPRIALELTQVDGGISVLPTLVYGSPASARVDAGRLVFLQGAVPLRDEVMERSLAQQLRDALNLAPGRRSTFTGAERGPFLEKLQRWRGALTGDAARLLSPGGRLVATLRTESLEAGPGRPPDVAAHVAFRVEGTEKEVDAASVLRAWSEGLGLVPLAGGGFAPLPSDFLAVHGQKLWDLLEARGEGGRVAVHGLATLGELCDALEAPRPLGLERLAPLLEGFERLPEPTLPPDLTATLRDYQREGVRWLSFLRAAELGGVLADDMGLGKTLQTLCALDEGALVVCPTSVLANWEAEVRRFRPGLTVNVYHGPARALDPRAHVTLTTYALLRLDGAALASREWRAVVLDEAQAIKNPDSQVARAAFALRARFRLALSGTPVENRLEELWSALHFTNPGLLGGRRAFDERWARPIAEGRPDAAAALRRRIKPFVLRRLKRDVAADLPPRTDAVLPIALDERERALYETVLAATRTEVVAQLGAGGSGVLKALEALLRLRQAACHPALVPGQAAQTSSKVEALVEALRTAADEGHKALVFSQWTAMLDLLEPALESAGLDFTRLDGSTVDRGAVTARFQASDGPPVMLISLKAGGTGLNLTAADHVFLMDPWWNPAVEAQAADRAHRIGQERPVNVYRLIARGTVEERILALQDKKRALFDAALGDAASASHLSKDDLLELLR